ncbi:MAG: right-handed parallel beta-helix repeat-containing protein [Acidobacteriota bacterium]
MIHFKTVARKPARKLGRLLTALALFGLVPAAGYAVDGVIEINQTAALAGGVTSGDTPGFPVTLSESGSYRLTGNLTVVGGDFLEGIDVTGSGITIDLNGFTISGPAQGTGHGIFGDINAQRVTVLNGSITKMGGEGIWIFGAGAQIRGVKSFENGASGFRMGNQALVDGCTAWDNGDDGILVSDGGIIRNSTADGNGREGLVGSFGCMIVGNTTIGNTSDGIVGTLGCLVKDNVSRNNFAFGLNLPNKGGYIGNIFTNNGGGDVTGGAKALGNNICDDGGVCP